MQDAAGIRGWEWVRLYREAGRLRDGGGDASKAASMAKLFASDVAMRVTTGLFDPSAI